MEKALRAQISQMESALKADVSNRNELLEKLAKEIGTKYFWYIAGLHELITKPKITISANKDVIQRDFRTLQTANLQLKAKCEELEQKLKQLTEVSCCY